MSSRKFWRSLDELEGTPEFENWLHREFPQGAAEFENEFSRRDFLRLMSASLALAGLGACTKQPIEKIVPYVKQPEEIVPGKPLHFATATTFGGYGQGIIVTSNEGRPTKIEGNPDHPASFGATTIWGQADVLDLYDPDRAQSVTHGGEISTWENFLQQLNLALVRQQAVGGAGLRILTQTITSPTLRAQWQAVLQRFPQAKWHSWEPITRDSLRDANAGGVYGAEAIYDFKKAKVIVALDSDFLCMHPAALRHARDFASARRMTAARGARMNRLYVAEPTPTITGSSADHRVPIAARDVQMVARELAAELGAAPHSGGLPAPVAQWVRAAARDLNANRGATIVIAGEGQPSQVHTIVNQLNAALGNIGATISYSTPIAINSPNQLDSLRALAEEMKNGAVELLLILSGNPAYDAPVDFDFAGALEKVKLRVHHSLQVNETSRLCHWHIPAAHFLESWSDVRSSEGVVSIVQPLIEPLYAGVSAHELIDVLVEQPARSGYEVVRESWQSKNRVADFALNWRTALSKGVIESLDLTRATVSVAGVADPGGAANDRGYNQLEILFRPDPNVLDGRYANNGWLQELPRPFTKLTWDNAALVSPKLAEREKLENGDVVKLNFRGRTLNAPIWITPGQAENSVTLHLGYGRTEVGRVGRNVGFNAYALRTSDALWYGDGLTIRKTGETHRFATTQHHYSVEGRDLIRAGTLAEFLARPHFADNAETPEHNETLYHPDEFANSGYAWGMVIDLNTCIGCNACTIACQAENNIPVVGKDQVARGREMHWIRVDTYYEGAPSNPTLNHQPVPCMHCEHAPCELVCPVAATVHDAEGLNLQVYNRCIGTRYCSNNCPYKVRRFNFLELNGTLSPTEKLVKNPDVTVRSRGVMEKCTYCLQRINAARIIAELEQRTIRDGEITPACAQVCPTEAITFGNIHDANSRVAKLKTSPLNYGMLAELNTRPRTTYLAKLRNPNPGMA